MTKGAQKTRLSPTELKLKSESELELKGILKPQMTKTALVQAIRLVLGRIEKRDGTLQAYEFLPNYDYLINPLFESVNNPSGHHTSGAFSLDSVVTNAENDLRKKEVTDRDLPSKASFRNPRDRSLSALTNIVEALKVINAVAVERNLTITILLPTRKRILQPPEPKNNHPDLGSDRLNPEGTLKARISRMKRVNVTKFLDKTGKDLLMNLQSAYEAFREDKPKSVVESYFLDLLRRGTKPTGEITKFYVERLDFLKNTNTDMYENMKEPWDAFREYCEKAQATGGFKTAGRSPG